MKNIHYGWWIVVACCAITCCPGIVMLAAANFYSPVANDLGVGIGTLTIYMTVMTLTMALLQPIVGALLEKHLKPILLLGGVLMYGAMALMSTFNSVYLFWIAGFFLGAGGAVTIAMAVPIIINMWFEKSRGLALGISYSFTGIAGALFGMLAGYGITAWGWRTSYLVIALCGLAIYVPAILLLIKTPQQKGVLPYGCETAATQQIGQPETASDGMTLAQAVKSPVFYVMLVCTVALAALSSQSTQVSAFSTEHFGLTIGAAASVAAVCSIGNMLGNIIMGGIDDKFGHAKTLLFALIVIIIAQVALLSANAIPAVLTPAVFACGFMFTIYSVLLPCIASSVFGGKDFSRIWAYIMSAGSVAGAVIIPVFGMIFDVTGAYTGVFYLVIVLSAICAVTGLIALKSAKY